MPDEMQSQPRPNGKLSLLRFGVLIGFAAGIGIGPRLSQDVRLWVLLLSILAALFFYYRRERT
jgi:hypothetical protein